MDIRTILSSKISDAPREPLILSVTFTRTLNLMLCFSLETDSRIYERPVREFATSSYCSYSVQNGNALPQLGIAMNILYDSTFFTTHLYEVHVILILSSLSSNAAGAGCQGEGGPGRDPAEHGRLLGDALRAQTWP